MVMIWVDVLEDFLMADVSNKSKEMLTFTRKHFREKIPSITGQQWFKLHTDQLSKVSEH